MKKFLLVICSVVFYLGSGVKVKRLLINVTVFNSACNQMTSVLTSMWGGLITT